jgi:hypothetical protein
MMADCFYGHHVVVPLEGERLVDELYGLLGSGRAAFEEGE